MIISGELIVGLLLAAPAADGGAAREPNPATPEIRRVEVNWVAAPSALGKSELVARGLERRDVERLDLPQTSPLTARPGPDGRWIIEHAETSGKPAGEAAK